MKYETRMPNAERNPKPEIRNPKDGAAQQRPPYRVTRYGSRFTFHVSRIAALALFALTLRAQTLHAQTTTNSAPQQFYTMAFQYFTSFDTNLLTFQTNYHGCAWAGADYQSGVNVASSLGLEYGVYKSAVVESVTRNAAIAGTILSQQIDLGLSYTLFDTQLTGGAGLDYNFANAGSTRQGVNAVLFAEVKKAMTQSTFAGLRLETDIPFRKAAAPTPVLSVFVGFKF
jgi:hypothetical protein